VETLALKGVLRVVHFRPGVGVLSDETMAQTITTVGKNWAQDLFQEADAAADALKWHKSGIGVAVAAAANTDLSTGIYSRVAGTQAEGASANIYKSVATVNYTGTRSITEWGIFTTSTGGTLFSRKTFAAKSVANGDSIQFTWNLTLG
jgi:hypothetical protein